MMTTIGLALAALIAPLPPGAARDEPAPALASAQLGAWTTHAEASALDGKGLYKATLDASNRTPDAAGVPRAAALIVRCTPASGVESFIYWPAYVGSGEATVSYRFDEGPVLQAVWSGSGSGMANGFFDAPDNRAFLGAMALSHRLVVRSPRYNATPMEATFELEGAAEVVAATLRTCAAAETR